MRPAPRRDAALLERGDVRSTAVRKLCELSDGHSRLRSDSSRTLVRAGPRRLRAEALEK